MFANSLMDSLSKFSLAKGVLCSGKINGSAVEIKTCKKLSS